MRIFKGLCLLGLAALLGGCSLFGVHDVASAPYTVLERTEPFEIRQYPVLLVARTSMDGDADKGSGDSFRRLFNYISGENSGRKTVAMTTPVLQQKQAGEPIAMTAPVFMSRTTQARTMSFVLPEGYTLANAPQPTNAAVKLAEISAQKMATVTFSGFLNESNIRAQMQVLEQWLRDRRLKATGDATAAGYDPPWTIPFWRRNEVLIPIE